MNYTIGTTQRNLMIFSAAFLIAYTLYNAFFFMGLSNSLVEPDAFQTVVRDFLYAIPYAYLLWILFTYYRHNGWKILQYTMLLAFIIEIAIKTFKTIVIIGSFDLKLPGYSMGVGMFWLTIIIIQAVFLLRLSRKEHPEVLSLQKYALALILFQVIAFGIPVLFRSESFSSMVMVIRILSCIPYFFLIEFTLKLKSKEDIVSDSRVSS